MRFGINSFLFTSPFTSRSTSLFPKFKKWGSDTVEIPVEDPSHINPKTVKAALDRNGLVCGSVCACMSPDRDLRGTAKQQKEGLAYMKALIDQMVVLDCPSLIGPVYLQWAVRTPFLPKSMPNNGKPWSSTSRPSALMLKNGQGDLPGALNRFETDFINTCDQGLKMIKDVGSKALKLHLDTFHMNIEEKIKAKQSSKPASIWAIFTPAAVISTPGNDHIDWKPIVAALKRIRYKGDVVIESFTTDVKVIAKAAAIWRRMEPTRDEIAVKGLKFLKKNIK